VHSRTIPHKSHATQSSTRYFSTQNRPLNPRGSAILSDRGRAPAGEECRLEKCAFCEHLTALSYHNVPICLACFEVREREGNAQLYSASEKHSEKAHSADAPPPQTDTAIVTFLRSELAVDFANAKTARLDPGLDCERRKRARQIAKDVVETILWFRNRIDDPAIHLELQEGAARLERLLSDGPETHT
jgi:hypothetical protein